MLESTNGDPIESGNLFYKTIRRSVQGFMTQLAPLLNQSSSVRPSFSADDASV